MQRKSKNHLASPDKKATKVKRQREVNLNWHCVLQDIFFPFSTWFREINNLWDNEHWFSLDNGTFSYSLFLCTHHKLYLHTKSPFMAWIASVVDALFSPKKKALSFNKRQNKCEAEKFVWRRTKICIEIMLAAQRDSKESFFKFAFLLLKSKIWINKNSLMHPLSM